MNKRFLSLIGFAIIMSGLVSLLIYRMVMAKMTASSRGPSARILVASRTLTTGTLIRDEDLKLVDWTGAVPAQTVVKKEDALGRGVVANIYEGEPVVESRLAAKGGGAGLAAIIPKGMRAVAVRVNEVVGVAGFVTPGMRVDVLVSANAPGTRNEVGLQTKTVLQNIEVLSAGPNIQKDAEGKPVTVTVVNLAVTPEQAEVLSLASNDTKIQLILRNPLDTDAVKTPGVNLAGLLGRPAEPKAAPRPALAIKAVKQVAQAAPPPVPPPPPKIVEVLHGGKKVEVKFSQSAEAKQ